MKLDELSLGTEQQGQMLLLSLVSYAGLWHYNQSVLAGRREDEALMTFMAWVWISSFVMMLGGIHKLKFCAIGTIVLFSNMPMLSLIGLGWIGAFESMMWLCFQAPTNTTSSQSSLYSKLSAEQKRQKRLDFVRKTVVTRRISTELCGDACAICLVDFCANDTVCFSPNAKCTHGFHLHCAERWLSQHVRCPCCRENYLQKAGRRTVLPEVDPSSSCLKQR